MEQLDHQEYQQPHPVSGFSLIEVLVALLLIAGSVSVSLVVLMSGSIWEKKIREDQNAVFADFFIFQKAYLDAHPGANSEASQ